MEYTQSTFWTLAEDLRHLKGQETSLCNQVGWKKEERIGYFWVRKRFFSGKSIGSVKGAGFTPVCDFTEENSM